MARTTGISWCDATLPIVAGCDYESPGCSNCWAVRDSWRLAHSPYPHISAAFKDTVRKTDDGKLVWTGLVRPLPDRLLIPFTWKTPLKIFICNTADLFHPKVPDRFIDMAFAMMVLTRWHTHQVLTKHAKRMREYMTTPLRKRLIAEAVMSVSNMLAAAGRERIKMADFEAAFPAGDTRPFPNIWLGVTTERQQEADNRVPDLVLTPAAVRFISYEPALELVDFNHWLWQPGAKDEEGFRDVEPADDIHQIIFGGESAQTRARTRECDIEWARKTRDDCRDAGVAFFMKQLGSRPVCHEDHDHSQIPNLPAGKSTRYKWHEPQYWPLDIRVQEFPT